MAKENQYFNFPVSYLHGFVQDHETALRNILNLCVYEHSLRLDMGTEHERMRSAVKFFNIDYEGDFNTGVSATLSKGKELYKKVKVGVPRVGISLITYWDFRNAEKDEYDVLCLVAYLALKSIVGSKKYMKLSNEFWLARMDGKAESCPFNKLSPYIGKFANEYQTKKIKNSLRERFNLVTYSRYTRGFYVSFSLSLEDLILEAEKRRKSSKLKEYKIREKEAIAAALKKLG